LLCLFSCPGNVGKRFSSIFYFVLTGAIYYEVVGLVVLLIENSFYLSSKGFLFHSSSTVARLALFFLNEGG